MKAGVTLRDPATVYFSWDTEIARDVMIEPNVWFGPGVKIGEGAKIFAFSHIENAMLGPGVTVGPFARMRGGAVLEDDVHIGNFVELKKAHLGKGVKAGHLSYLGDAEIGASTNIGAGTITCNYDGVNKSVTTIGENVFIGSQRLAGRAGDHRRRRLHGVGQRHHQGCRARRAGDCPRPAGEQAGLRGQSCGRAAEAIKAKQEEGASHVRHRRDHRGRTGRAAPGRCAAAARVSRL